MARRRRTFSSCICFSTSLSSVVVCFQERTSCTFSNFAQSGRRRFTESSFGVSLFASDAEPSKTCSLPPTAFVRSSFEPSDLASNKESLELVARVPRASQIWISDLTSAILMSLVVRGPSMLSRRAVSSPSCFSGVHRSAPHQLPSPVASAVLPSGRLLLHPLSAEQTLGLKVLGQFWLLQIMGRVLVMGLMGLMDQKHVFMSPQPNMPSFLRRCCSSQKPPPSAFISLAPHLLAPQEVSSASHQIALQEVISATLTTPGLPCDLLQDVRSGFVRAKQQIGALSTVWSLAPTTPGLPCDLLQDVRSGFVRAKQQTGPPPTGLGTCPLYPWICWNFWKSRSQKMFIDRCFSEVETMCKSIKDAREWQDAHETLSPPSLPKRGTLPSIFMSKMSSKSLVKLTNLMSVEENSLKTVSSYHGFMRVRLYLQLS